jgi:hypothetical protein
MPNIAAHHCVEQAQVIDSLQHYRFGYRQAENLIVASGAVGIDYELLGLFTIVHDIGRMMVGSGASKFRYPRMAGNLLHPVVGAIMLREAFRPLRDHVADRVWQLLEALVCTAERHTLSIGLTATAVQKSQLPTLNIAPYHGLRGALLLVDAPISPEFAKYGHLVALADLVNNVSERLEGTTEYRPIHAVPGTAAERAEYVRNGRDSGLFQVVPVGKSETVTVRRCWSDGVPISKKNLHQVRETMKVAALRFASDDQRHIVADAFDKGFAAAFPGVSACHRDTADQSLPEPPASSHRAC